MYSRALCLWPDIGEDSSSTLARRWSRSVLGSVAQPDTCGVEPLQAVAIVVFRCQLNSVLSDAWLDIFVMPRWPCKPFVALHVPDCVMISTMLHCRDVRPDILGWRTGRPPLWRDVPGRGVTACVEMVVKTGMR